MVRKTRRRAARCAGATTLLVAAALLSAPQVARAQCVQSGSDVTCAGTDPDGFPDDPGGRPPANALDDDLTITVEANAVVSNAGSNATIVLLENNVVTIEQDGGVTARGGQTAITGADGVPSGGVRQNRVTNAGTISLSGADSGGIDLGALGEVTNAATGRIVFLPGLASGNSIGVHVGANGFVRNDGVVDISGAQAIGISARGIGALVESSGAVIVSGDGSVGIGARTIDHSGTTTANGDAAVGLRTSGSADNTGTVTVQGTGAIGMESSTAAQVTNAGTVTVSGDGVRGMLAGDRGTATNDGQLDVDGPNAIGLSGRTPAFTRTNLFNTGTVTTAGDASTAARVDTRVQLDNSGTLDASASADGIGIRLDGTQSQAINSGTVRGGSGGGAAVVFSDAGSAGETKQFSNEIGGRIEAASGVAIVGGDGADGVVNRGDIQGAVRLGSGDDSFSWGDRSSLNGALDAEDGRDTLRLIQSDPSTPVADSFDLGRAVSFEGLVVGNSGDAGVWTLTGSGDYPDGIFLPAGELRIDSAASVQNELSVVGGVLHLDDGVSLPAGARVLSGRAVFGTNANVAADLRVSGSGVIALDGTSALQGDLSLDGATLESRFDSAANADRLDVDGDISLGSSAVLSLTKTSAAPIAGTQSFRLLTATGSRTGRFADVDLTGSGLGFLRAIPSYGSAAGLGFVDIELTASFAAVAQSSNERAVGQQLDAAVLQGVSPEFQEFLDGFLPLSNNQAANALDALHGTVYDAHTSTAFATASRYVSLLATRPLRCERLISPYRPDQPSLSPCGNEGITAWVTGLGIFADRNGGSGQEDWSSAGGGVAFGVDKRLGGDLIVSALLGTSRSALDLDDSGDASYTSFEAGIGVAWSRAGTHLRGAFEYGHGWHTTRRQISIPGFSRLALSDYDSNRFTLLAEIGHSFVFAPFEIEPIASVEYVYLSEESTSESNAGVVKLDIDSRTNGLVTTRTGLRAGMTLVKYAYLGSWLEWADGVWRPEIRASWRQVFNDYDRALSSRLDGAPGGTPKFRTRTTDAQYGGDLGAKLIFQPRGSRNTIEIAYDAFVGDRTTVHGVTARLRVPF